MAAKMFMNMPGESKMPTIGLGTFAATDEKELETTLNAALVAGYRHIDTAFVYRNEAVIGRVLKEWISSKKLKREDLFITTKLPNQAMHEDRVEMFIKKSLDSLQLDYVDLYLIHGPIGIKYIDESAPRTRADNIEAVETDHIAVWKA